MTPARPGSNQTNLAALFPLREQSRDVGTNHSNSETSYRSFHRRFTIIGSSPPMHTNRKQPSTNRNCLVRYTTPALFSSVFSQEVKTLEGSLADYNLAVDKARTTADPGEVTKYLHDLEDQNR